MKVCKDCNIQKPLEHFPWRRDQNKYRPYCKPCSTLRRKPSRAVYLEKTRAHRRIKGKEYKQKNKDSIKEKNKLYTIKNKERIRLKNKQYQIDNKDYMNKVRNDYRKNRIKADPLYCMKLRLRSRLRGVFQIKGLKKQSSTLQILGCSLEFFKSHIESQFLPEMTWDNRNLWHLDHIAPASLATTVQELEILNHYTNIRPLWGRENEAKSNTLTEEAKQSISNLEKLFNIVFTNK
jgi:hypothetical protein